MPGQNTLVVRYGADVHVLSAEKQKYLFKVLWKNCSRTVSIILFVFSWSEVRLEKLAEQHLMFE